MVERNLLQTRCEVKNIRRMFLFKILFFEQRELMHRTDSWIFCCKHVLFVFAYQLKWMIFLQAIWACHLHILCFISFYSAQPKCAFYDKLNFNSVRLDGNDYHTIFNVGQHNQYLFFLFIFWFGLFIAPMCYYTFMQLRCICLRKNINIL